MATSAHAPHHHPKPHHAPDHHLHNRPVPLLQHLPIPDIRHRDPICKQRRAFLTLLTRDPHRDKPRINIRRRLEAPRLATPPIAPRLWIIAHVHAGKSTEQIADITLTRDASPRHRRSQTINQFAHLKPHCFGQGIVQIFLRKSMKSGDSVRPSHAIDHAVALVMGDRGPACGKSHFPVTIPRLLFQKHLRSGQGGQRQADHQQNNGDRDQRAAHSPKYSATGYAWFRGHDNAFDFASRLVTRPRTIGLPIRVKARANNAVGTTARSHPAHFNLFA